MSVYIDKAKNKYYRFTMSHMIADTPEELHAMAAKLGLMKKWFQDDASVPHYDIAQTKKMQALALGAVELGRREFVTKMNEVRKNWPRRRGRWL